MSQESSRQTEQLRCLSNHGRTKGQGGSTANFLKLHSHFIAGRPKSALLVWFLWDFLFIVLYINIETGKNRC